MDRKVIYLHGIRQGTTVYKSNDSQKVNVFIMTLLIRIEIPGQVIL